MNCCYLSIVGLPCCSPVRLQIITVHHPWNTPNTRWIWQQPVHSSGTTVQGVVLVYTDNITFHKRHDGKNATRRYKSRELRWEPWPLGLFDSVDYGKYGPASQQGEEKHSVNQYVNHVIGLQTLCWTESPPLIPFLLSSNPHSDVLILSSWISYDCLKQQRENTSTLQQHNMLSASCCCCCTASCSGQGEVTCFLQQAFSWSSEAHRHISTLPQVYTHTTSPKCGHSL